MTITKQTLVSEIATVIPSSIRVFQRVGIDFCCGGKKPVGVACEEHDISFASLAREIEASAAERRNDRDWTGETLHAVVDHIIATYHVPLREELPRLENMATRVLRVHGAKAPQVLGRLAAIVGELSADLQDHMRTEERLLFPALCALETGTQAGPAAPIAAPIAVMEQEHDRAGDLLAELRRITGGYTAPDWACGTCRALYQGLEELEHEMQLHVHLENNVLFPAAQRLAGLTAAH